MQLFIFIFYIILFTSGCNSDTDRSLIHQLPPSQEPNFSNLSPSCFVPYSNDPILSRDSLLPGSDWNDPSILKIDDQYVMYASSDQNFNYNIAIYRLISKDGINWSLNPSNPVFQSNPDPLSWDHRAVETPSVIYFNSKYHMFYTGYPITHTNSYSFKIGHAISNDGITWERTPNYIAAPNDPLNSTPNLTFNQWVVAEPAAVIFQNKIYLYFSAIGASLSVGTTLQTIGLITSTDGLNWSTPKSVLIPNQVNFPRSLWLGYSTPHAIVLNNKLHLFFDVIQASPWKQLKLHHASSLDGENNWELDPTAIFENTSFSWTSNEIRSPSVLLDGTTLHFWFAGDNGSTLGIGYGKCKL